jgi:hypothetical protein
LTSLTIDTQFGVDLGYSSQQEALNLESYDEQVLEPATSRIAHYIDTKLFQAAYYGVANHVGTPGTDPNSIDTYIDAGVVLDDNAVPTSQRRVVHDAVDAGRGHQGGEDAVQPQADQAKCSARARWAPSSGFDFYMAQGIKRHTIGAYAGTPLTNAAPRRAARR